MTSPKYIQKSNALQSILNTLQLPPRVRTSNELSELIEITQNSEIFKRIFREHQNTELQRFCCMYLTLEEHQKDSPVYSIGDSPNGMYIILSGAVSIDIPNKMKTSISIPKEYQKAVKDLKNSISAEHGSQIEQHEPMLRDWFSDLLAWDNKIIEDIYICKPRDIAEKVNAGQSFGTLALVSDRLRSHNAVCTEKSCLAVFSRQSFQKSIQLHNEKKIYDRIDFLQNLSLFSTWPRASVTKFLEFLTHATYCCNQKIFKEGEPTDFGIFVMSGEVKITKSQFTNKKIIEPAQFTSGPLRLEKARDLQKSSQLQLIIKGKNSVIGFDDLILKDKPRTYSCFCYSSRAEVLVIPRQVFLERINRPENLNYLTSKTSSENLWLKERVKEINSTDLKIKRRPQTRPKTNSVKARVEPPPVIGRRNSMVEKRLDSPVSVQKRNRRNSVVVERPDKSQQKRPMSRLPPPNFLLSFRRKKYGEPIDPPFYTYMLNKTQ